MTCQICGGAMYIRNSSRPNGWQRCPRGCQCFPAETRILTPTGYRPIGDMVEGSRIVTLDPASGVHIPSTVKKLLRHDHGALWAVEFGQAPLLRVTSDHSFLLADGRWRMTKDLEPGDLMSCADGGSRSVLRVKALDEHVPVFNIHTYGQKTFVVEGLVAHCFTHLRAVRVIAHRVAELMEMPSRTFPLPT